MTSSSGNIFRVTGHLCGEFIKASDAELWCFPWSASWIKGSVNSREAGNLRRYRAHYDVIVMYHNRTSTGTTHQCFLGPVWRRKQYIQYPFLVHGVSAIAVIRQANKGSLLVHCDVENEKAGIGATYTISFSTSFPLLWRHNGRDGVSNHQPHDCLLNGSFRRRSKKTSKLRVIGLCPGIHRSPVNSPHKWPCNAQNVSIWWRHHAIVVTFNTDLTLTRPISFPVCFKYIIWIVFTALMIVGCFLQRGVGSGILWFGFPVVSRFAKCNPWNSLSACN